MDVVLLVILMPGSDGYEVCRPLRGERRTAFLPIVMVTSNVDDERVRAIESAPALRSFVASLSPVSTAADLTENVSTQSVR